MWGLVGRWKEIGKMHMRFCNVILGLPKICTNYKLVAKLAVELRRDKGR
jgi:hypothetical protein